MSTVLSRYERLECPGIWLETAEAQRRNVYVTLGKATLVIKDANDVALAHWSLPAVDRLNPGENPALFAPGTDSPERLELDDDIMLDAIATVRSALRHGDAHPGRLRRGFGLAALVSCLALAAILLPDALTRHTARALPETARQDIGNRLLAEMEPVTGAVCRSGRGVTGLTGLVRQTFGADAPRVAVVPSGPVPAMVLPGDLVVLRRDLIEDFSDPSAMLTAITVELERARATDPMLGVMDRLGLRAVFGLLTSGQVTDAALSAVAEAVPLSDRGSVDPDAVAARLAELGISGRSYGAVDGADRSLADVVSRPGRGAAAFQTSDAAWLRVQSICAR